MLDLRFPHGAFRVSENELEKDFDGGRVVLAADNGEQAKTTDNPKGNKLIKASIMGVTVTINYNDDEPMKDWPSVREEIAKRRFNVHIWEEDPATAPAPEKPKT